MLYLPKAFVLGFVALGTARDVVRGFCATFATKSGKENGQLGCPRQRAVDANRLICDESWQDVIMTDLTRPTGTLP